MIILPEFVKEDLVQELGREPTAEEVEARISRTLNAPFVDNEQPTAKATDTPNEDEVIEANTDESFTAQDIEDAL